MTKSKANKPRPYYLLLVKRPARRAVKVGWEIEVGSYDKNDLEWDQQSLKDHGETCVVVKCKSDLQADIDAFVASFEQREGAKLHA